MRQQHRAGEKLFADFAGQTVPILGRDGGVVLKAHVFVAVLGASNYTYACATRSEAMPDWIGSLIDALEFYGGVPELLVPDNPKALIAKADRYEPVLGNTTQDFVNHYTTAMLPAHPRKPQDKAKVEVGVQIVERWILARLRNHRFYSLAELNKAIGKLIADLNRRPFKKLEGNRHEWFERLDRPALRPLPARRYEIATFVKCRVNIDYHVEVDHHYYSVPHSLVRQEVYARVTRHGVEILHRGKRVAAQGRRRCTRWLRLDPQCAEPHPDRADRCGQDVDRLCVRAAGLPAGILRDVRPRCPAVRGIEDRPRRWQLHAAARTTRQNGRPAA